MIPRTTLDKMRLGIGGAGLALLLQGCGEPLAVTKPEGEGSIVPQPKTVPAAALLTAEELALLQEQMPRLISDDQKVARAAWETIFNMGESALPLLRAEARTTDVKLQRAITRLIRWIQAKGDPCPPCGMG